MKLFQNRSQMRRDSRRLRKKEEDIYNAIKEQPELVPVSKKLATRSITFSILSMLTLIIALVAIYFVLTELFIENFLLALFILLIGGSVLIYLFIYFVAKSITCLVFQFKLNRKAHTWIALSLLILPAIILVVGIIIVAGAAVGA